MIFSELDLPQFAAHGQGGSGPSKAGADQAIDTGMQIDMAVEQTNRWGWQGHGDKYGWFDAWKLPRFITGKIA